MHTQIQVLWGSQEYNHDNCLSCVLICAKPTPLSLHLHTTHILSFSKFLSFFLSFFFNLIHKRFLALKLFVIFSSKSSYSRERKLGLLFLLWVHEKMVIRFSNLHSRLVFVLLFFVLFCNNGRSVLGMNYTKYRKVGNLRLARIHKHLDNLNKPPVLSIQVINPALTTCTFIFAIMHGKCVHVGIFNNCINRMYNDH